MPLVIGLDFDGTLSPTGHDYDRAHLTAALITLTALGRRGPVLKEMWDRQRMIDDALVAEYQFQIRRTPLSWLETYRYFCHFRRLPFDRMVARKIYRATSECIRRGPFELYDGVRETLSTLSTAGHELHCLTIGEEVHQRHKLVTTGLAPFFGDRIHVIPLDKREKMRQVFGGREHRSLMVGDSPDSDIRPALELGIRAVWAGYGNPARQHNGPLEGNYQTIMNFSELGPLVQRLENGSQSAA